MWVLIFHRFLYTMWSNYFLKTTNPDLDNNPDIVLNMLYNFPSVKEYGSVRIRVIGHTDAVQIQNFLLTFLATGT